MKVIEKHIMIDEDEMRAGVEIEIDGVTAFSVSDGEPEDNNLYRNFDACHSIGHLMQRAYDAGKAGEMFVHEVIEVDGKDGW